MNEWTWCCCKQFIVKHGTNLISCLTWKKNFHADNSSFAKHDLFRKEKKRTPVVVTGGGSKGPKSWANGGNGVFYVLYQGGGFTWVTPMAGRKTKLTCSGQ